MADVHNLTNKLKLHFKEFVANVKTENDETDLQMSWIVLPLFQKGITLRVGRSPYPAIPIERDRYSGTEDEWYGRSFMEVGESIVKHDEDMYGYVNDVARREVFRPWFVPDDMDDSEFTPSEPDKIVHVKAELLKDLAAANTIVRNPQLMPNMQEQRQITGEILDEISAVIDFVKGAGTDPEESATLSSQKMQFLTKRFKKRMKYYENHGLREWMEWQCVLNHLYLTDDVLKSIVGDDIPINPFIFIQPVIPMQSFNFIFEGSTKATDDPVKAQIIRNMIEIAGSIQPGMDDDGQIKQPNLLALYKKYCRLISGEEDIDEYLMPAAIPGIGGLQGNGPAGLGVTNPAELMSGVQGMPSKGAGVAQEIQNARG